MIKQFYDGHDKLEAIPLQLQLTSKTVSKLKLEPKSCAYYRQGSLIEVIFKAGTTMKCYSIQARDDNYTLLIRHIKLTLFRHLCNE